MLHKIIVQFPFYCRVVFFQKKKRLFAYFPSYKLGYTYTPTKYLSGTYGWSEAGIVRHFTGTSLSISSLHVLAEWHPLQSVLPGAGRGSLVPSHTVVDMTEFLNISDDRNTVSATLSLSSIYF